MVNERKIDYLLKIAETQSITRAAKELYVSQSALSQLIASLEKTYDTKIFEYKGGHLTPTYTGEMILNTFRQQQLLEGRLNWKMYVNHAPGSYLLESPAEELLCSSRLFFQNSRKNFQTSS